MREQLNFLQEKIARSRQELEEKERLVQQIEREKREYIRKYESLEFANFEIQEKLNQIQSDKENLERMVNQNKNEENK